MLHAPFSLTLKQRLLLAWWLVFGSLCPLVAQDLDSRFGDVHSPEGDLHVLLIFVRYHDANLMPNSTAWPDTTAQGILPQMALGEINDLFHTHPDDIGRVRKQNLSDYYYTMSGGRLRLTGDIYPYQVPVSHVSEQRSNFFSRQGAMNQEAVKWIAEHDPDFDWSRYDRRTNRPRFGQSNVDSPPDSILDYVVFMHRAPGSTGMGSPSNLGIPGSRYRILDGHTGLKSYDGHKHNWLYFKHEFAHNLYSSPHYLGANSADGNRYYTQKGWGMMSAWHAPFFTANAWESWWLGWLEVQEIDSPGTYTLRDYLTGRDAMRIRIPGTEDFLWLENHQKIDPWDDKLFFKDAGSGQPQSAPGLYAYLVGNPGADRSRPRLQPFSAQQVNFLRMLHARGNHDWHPTGDSLHTGYFLAPVMEQMAPNPISGQNPFQFLRADYNRDGQIGVGHAHGNSDSGGKEQLDLWVERVGGENRLTIANSGTERDAFRPGMELGLSSLTPVTSYPRYFPREDSLEAYVLTGIRVRVVEQDLSGSLRLDIRLDDWQIRRDARWCGRIKLPSRERLGDSVALSIAPGTTLKLALSGTPQRQQAHPVTGTFAPPTELRIGAGQTLVVERRGKLRIGPHSRLVLEVGASLVVEPGASVVVESGGALHLLEDNHVEVGRLARIKVDSGAKASGVEAAQLRTGWLARVKW